MTITLWINGREESVPVAATDNLRNALGRAGFFSVRYGSDDGATGASAVLLDGRLVNSDTMLAGQAEGHEIETVEGLIRQVTPKT